MWKSGAKTRASRHGNYAFLLTHAAQTDKYVRALKCGARTGIRRCALHNYHNIPELGEVVFASYPEAQAGGAYGFSGGLNPADAAQVRSGVRSV